MSLPGPTHQLGIGRAARERLADRRPPDWLIVKGFNPWQPSGTIDERALSVVHNQQVSNPIAGCKFGGELRTELGVRRWEQLRHDHRRSEDRHEVGVSLPARDDMLVEMVGNTRPG